MINLLDHGYVRHIESWGRGEASERLDPQFGFDYEVGIVEAARQSTQGAFRGWAEDAKLLKRLYANNHATPFEFAGMVIEVRAPIMVFREWHRHRTQSYNEMSARYAALPDLMYCPDEERCLRVNLQKKNTQATGVKDAPPLTAEGAVTAMHIMRMAATGARAAYENLLALGMAKELARGVLPVFQYSQMRASATLRNWLAFLTLRCDPLAQWEIQQYAWAVAVIIKEQFPQTYRLWANAEDQ